MESNVSLRCSCGDLRATVRGVSPDVGFRVICYCDDCQAFAHHLDRAPEILDPLGGTEIFQTSPARVELQRGELACVRLAPRGLFRWSSACCRSPIGNTLSAPSLPFVGLITCCLDAPDTLLGPIRARVHTRFAKSPVDGAGVHSGPPYALGLRLMGRMLISRLRGEDRTSPFFDSTTGEPVSPPAVLSESERAELYRVVQASRAGRRSAAGT